MAKEPAGAPDPGEVKPQPEHDPENTGDSSPPTEEGEAVVRQGEFDLGDERLEPAPGENESMGETPPGDETASQSEYNQGESESDPHHAGEEDSYHDEYADDHYGYHDDQYHDEHGEYHHEHHEEYQDSHYDDHHGGGQGYGGYDGLGGEEDDDEDEEEYGGPVKPFLEHLEDFRWMLVRVFASLLVGMVVALAGAKYIVAFLVWPLEQAQKQKVFVQKDENRFVPIMLGGDEQISTIKGVEALYDLFPEARDRLRELRIDLQKYEGQTNSDNATRTRIKSIKDEIEIIRKSVEPITAIRLQTATGLAPEVNTTAPMTMTVDRGTDNPRTDWKVDLKIYNPLNSFIAALKIALYGGLTISIPFVLYFVGQFVLPALKVTEKKWLYRVAGFGSVLFFAGVAFCYLLVMVVTLWVSVGFSHYLGFGADEWRADEFISFVAKFLIGMGLAFQMPLVILTLVKIGLFDDRGLSKFRVYAVVINLIASAIITPTGDPFTMCLVALPLQVLYEISILIARVWRKKDEAAAAEESEDEENK